MRYTIRSDSSQSGIKLCNNDTVSSVRQNIITLLNTRKGSVPMYREFGLPMSYIDRPQLIAPTIMAAEIKQAIEEFEPRASFVDLSFEYPTEYPHKIIAIVEVDINEQ